MSKPPIDWAHCRSFLAVMQAGSLSQAARSLGLTQPTLGRHIAGLEVSLGAKLFTRSPAGLLPTQAAQELSPHAEAMASASQALARAATGAREETRGVVRLTASDFVGVEVLPPMLARFRERHSRIDIELAVGNRQQDLLRREADIAVRMVRPKQSALIARRVGRIVIGLYAHRSYAERCGLPAAVSELAQHTVIGFDRDGSAFRDAPAAFRITRHLFAFRCDNDLAQLAALRAGYGIGGCQAPLAAREPGLIPVLPGAVSFGLEMWLAMHEDLRANQRVRLLFDHLNAELSAYARAGSGPAPVSAGPGLKSPSKSAPRRHMRG
jgi:DNA-binding transcriptional LysR family regulator